MFLVCSSTHFLVNKSLSASYWDLTALVTSSSWTLRAELHFLYVFYFLGFNLRELIIYAAYTTKTCWTIICCVLYNDNKNWILLLALVDPGSVSPINDLQRLSCLCKHHFLAHPAPSVCSRHFYFLRGRHSHLNVEIKWSESKYVPFFPQK